MNGQIVISNSLEGPTAKVVLAFAAIGATVTILKAHELYEAAQTKLRS
jgi:hypothetical protein